MGVRVCLSPHRPLLSAVPTSVGPPKPHRTHYTHSPAAASLLTPASTSCLECFLPITWGSTKGMGSGVRPESEFWLCHFLAMWSWAGDFDSLNLSFITCKMKDTVPLTQRALERMTANGYIGPNTPPSGTGREPLAKGSSHLRVDQASFPPGSSHLSCLKIRRA